MIKILMICHGNICRSPMAEFVMKDLIKKEGLEDKVFVASAATSREEIGNPVHYGTKRKLEQFGISVAGKYAVQLTKKDYETYDYLLGMDQQNIRNIYKIIGEDKAGKVCRLLDLVENKRDIADPWYTGNFDKTYDDVLEGCETLLSIVKKQLKEDKR